MAVQGLGQVGYSLAAQLHQQGTKLVVSDIRREPIERAADEFGATPVTPDAIYSADVDVFAPCALGAIVNDKTMPMLRARIVAGAANNQLAEGRHGADLAKQGILYAPDYVINAGGIIEVAYGPKAERDEAKLERHVEGIYGTLADLFGRAEAEDLPTSVIADRMAEERFQTAAN